MIQASKPAIDAGDLHKYSNPIPNRDYILSALKQSGNTLNRLQIAELLSLNNDDEHEALRRRLRAMERDGQLSFDRKFGYRPLEDKEIVTGRVIGHPEGFGFLARDEGGDDLLLNKRDMLRLFDGDRIQVRVDGVDRRGREKASLTKVLDRNTSQVVGKLCSDSDGYFIRPENSRIAHDIDVDKNNLNGAKQGQYVVVNITDYPCRQYNTFGKVSEVLGNAMAPGMEIEIAIREHGIPFSWPEQVTLAAKSMGTEVNECDKQHRLDLRELPFVTIDGEDAKDFDDAVYCEQQAGGEWRLWVAVADVSHYVAADSPLDREAQSRGTSVYFPGHVVPMLPEALSNGLCSLNPHVDRLVMACEMTIDTYGEMKSYQFSEAVIHSHARLTYKQVNALLTAPRSNLGRRMKKEFAELVPHITALHNLYGVLRKARTTRGSIDFDSQETQIQFSKERKIQKILPVERNDAHKLIEECMLCANVATARFLEKLKMPALYRNHAGPKTKKLEALRAFLVEKGLTLKGGDKPTPEDYDRLLLSIKDRSDASSIQAMVLRSLGQAEYSSDNSGHFGLAYSAYSHFTSPIRRYPDLMVHRAIRSVIRGAETGSAIRRLFKSVTGIGTDPVLRIKSATKLDRTSSYPYDKEHMNSLAARCSTLSRRADKASWDVEAWLKCEYMQSEIGNVFTSTISTVTNFGLFVELNDTMIEGLIHISALKKDFYHFDEAKQCLTGERSNISYAIGDTIDVKVVHVDMDRRKIEFTLKSRESKRTKC